MVVSKKHDLRKVAGHKNRGHLNGMDFGNDGHDIEIPRYEELTYLNLDDLEE